MRGLQKSARHQRKICPLAFNTDAFQASRVLFEGCHSVIFRRVRWMQQDHTVTTSTCCFRNILFSSLFCRKVASINVDVICDLLPPSFPCCPPTLLSFPVILLWWTKWAFSLADKQRWERERCCTATWGKKTTKKTQKKCYAECFARCFMVNGPFVVLQKC